MIVNWSRLTNSIYKCSKITQGTTRLVRCRAFTTSTAALPLADPPPEEVNVLRIPQLSVPAMSRAAARACHLAMAHNLHSDASYILNALHFSHLDRTKFWSHSLRGLWKDFQGYDGVVLDFGQPVPVRLSTHAVLHDLIRLGHMRKATTISRIMMINHIPIHPKTLKALFTVLLPEESRAFSTTKASFAEARVRLDRKEVLNAFYDPPSDPGLKCTLDILHTARRQRQRIGQDLYRLVIQFCILQGEIIAGTFLFCLLIKDWETKQKHLESCLAAATSDVATASRSRTGATGYMKFRDMHRAFLPSGTLMFNLVSSIDDALSIDPYSKDPAQMLRLHTALQALVPLATLLDQQVLPYDHLAPLLTTLSKVPRTKRKIWILDKDGVPRKINALHYYHGIIKRLVYDLPVHNHPMRRWRRIARREGVAAAGPLKLLPALDLHGYNALIHYSLRHRLDLRMAEELIEHMMTKRVVPLHPDITTYNILLRAATVLRRPDIARNILAALLRDDSLATGHIVAPAGDYESRGAATQSSTDLLSSSNTDEGVRLRTDESGSSSALEHLYKGVIPVEGSQQPRFENDNTSYSHITAIIGLILDGYRDHLRTSDLSTVEHPSLPFTRILHRLASRSFPTPAPRSTLQVDVYTLTALCCHVVASGEPEVVATAIRSILRDSFLVPRKKPSNVSQAQIQKMQQDSLKYLASLGPYFFTSALSALQKASRTRLAEQLWVIAVQAQELSLSGTENSIEPWCLPIEAYTVMIQCYAREVLKNPVIAFRRPPSKKVFFRHRLRRYPLWTRFTANDPSESSDISTMGRVMGEHLYRVLFAQVARLYGQMRQSATGKRKNIQFPKPDARFFNAVLRFASRNPSSRPRRLRTVPPNVWRQRAKRATSEFIRNGVNPFPWSEFLVIVAGDMEDWDFPVPVGLRHLFIGRHPLSKSRRPLRKVPIDTSPYMYPSQRHKSRAYYSLPTYKSKGLPLSREVIQRKKSRTTTLKKQSQIIV